MAILHGKGFAVVADEVRKLAERASSSTKEIGGLIRGIQITMQETVLAMAEGGNEVEVGVGKANAAGQALEAILKAAEAVREQAGLASNAATQMGASAGKLVSAADQVSSVVRENTIATGQMSASSDEVSRAIENITSISEENSAAIEEVSASSEEMSAQVQEVTAEALTLSQMAGALQEVVAQFKLVALA
ncbi:MAG: methyl-accepting chemotaxis protein [Anaerolineaceae bacterium]|nr:methyl-accepting chemotaxis protein [Anaerolineaceae bacterium]